MVFDPVVREYLYYRKRAFISGDTNVFIAHYPFLGQNNDLGTGINSEILLAEMYHRTFKLIDGDIDYEHYARMQVRQNGRSAEVILSMQEIYLNEDFSFTGSQVTLKLFLQQVDNRWLIIRTDERTQGELEIERRCK